jgi:hypothetical protein
MNACDVPSRVWARHTPDGPFVEISFWVKNSRAKTIIDCMRKAGYAEKDIRLETNPCAEIKKSQK